MNDAIDSKLEALAFQYVSFGLFTVVNNLWTLVAVVTAAVSVLGIRAAAGSSAVRLRRRQPGPAAPRVDVGGAVGGPIPEEERRLADAAAADDRSSAASTSGGDYCLRSEMGDGVTKGRRKFTAYYKDDGECEYVCDSSAAEAEEEAEDAGEGGSCGGGEWWESWERVLKARTGETWWYRCQDAGALDGAVVRLWDDSRCGGGGAGRRRGCSGRAAVWW